MRPQLFIFALTVWVLAVDCCDPTAYISCYSTHIQSNINPHADNFCHDIKTATSEFRKCMEEAMEGCSGAQLWQLENYVNLTLAGYAEYDPMCKGQCGDVFARQRQLGACMRQMAGVSANTMCPTVQLVAECAWNVAKGCETLEVMYQTSLLPTIISSNHHLECNIVVKGAPSSLPAGCENVAERMQAMSLCQRPFNTSGGAAHVCPAVQEIVDCAWQQAEGCSLSEAGFRSQIQSTVDTYNSMYGCGDRSEYNTTEVLPTEEEPPSTVTEEPVKIECIRYQQCRLDLAKQMGIGTNSSGQFTPEDQERVEGFNPAASFNNPGPFCQMFWDKIRIGAPLECMEEESMQCLGHDPFAELRQMLHPKADEGMLETFLNVLNKQLWLVKGNGSLNGTGWDLFMSHMCHPDCGGGTMSNFTKQLSNCVDAKLLAGEGTCGEFRIVVGCFFILNNINSCPMVRLILNGLKDRLRVMMAEKGLNCNSGVSVTLPTIPRQLHTGKLPMKFLNGTTEKWDGLVTTNSGIAIIRESLAPDAVAKLEIGSTAKSATPKTGGVIRGYGANMAPVMATSLYAVVTATLTHIGLLFTNA